MKPHCLFTALLLPAGLLCAAEPVKPAAADRLAMRLVDKGIELGCGSMGTFTLEFPKLILTEGTKLDPVEKQIAGDTATLTYEGGGTIAVNATGGRVTLRFAGLPESTQTCSTEFFIAPSYSAGGRWKTGDADGDFPETKPPKPHLYQGNSRNFEFSDINGKRLRFSLPEYTYVQVQDNREWGWNIFWVNFLSPCDRNRASAEIGIELDASAARRVVLVDRFGQTTRREFPGKVADETDLKTDGESEKEFYAGLVPPVRNRFGGLPGSGAKLGLEKSGFFHVEPKTVGGREVRVLVDPDGDACFHLGVCSFGPAEDFTTVENRADIFEWLPPREGEFAAAWHPEKWWNSRATSFYLANVIRKHGEYNEAAHLSRLVDRVRRAGFNASGAFSGLADELSRRERFPRVATLPLGAWSLGPAIPGVRGVFDPFEQANLDKMEGLFAGEVAADAGDPLIVGYFLDNEQAFEDLPKVIPELPAKHACKRALVSLLKERHPSVGEFNRAWGLDAASFDDLADRGLPVTTEAARADVRAFTEQFLETYYRVIVDCFRKHDSNHLLIGNRWQPGTADDEALCRVAGKYMDVISVNYYASGIDESFIRRVHEWSGGKPQMWSEFYFTATGESNAGPGGHDLPTQRERGLAYRHYVEAAASLGFVVGIEWFTLIDQAVSGRYFEGVNGERANTGLFNVADRPYRDMLTGMAETNAGIYDVWLEGKAPYRFEHPQFSGKDAGQ